MPFSSLPSKESNKTHPSQDVFPIDSDDVDYYYCAQYCVGLSLFVANANDALDFIAFSIDSFGSYFLFLSFEALSHC